MERWKNDVSDSFQTLAGVMNGEDGRQPVHRRPAGLPIRVREMDCMLADIQAQIQMLRRERTYLRLVRGELADRKPRKGVLHPAPPHEGAGSRLVFLESKKLEDFQGESRNCADGP